MTIRLRRANDYTPPPSLPHPPPPPGKVRSEAGLRELQLRHQRLRADGRVAGGFVPVSPDGRGGGCQPHGSDVQLGHRGLQNGQAGYGGSGCAELDAPKGSATGRDQLQQCDKRLR